MVMKYLGRVSMKTASEEQVKFAEVVRDKIQQQSPILEGFGNAKTVRNNNSSRFGKFVKVKFEPEGHMSGAFTINYLLEKSRIVTAASNERVYHALYQVCKGNMAPKFKLKGADHYKSTNAGKCLKVDGEDDSKDFDLNVEAMKICGMNEEEIESVWMAVAGVLIAQNIELKAKDADSSEIVEKTMPYLKQCCEVLRISEDALKREMLTTTSTVRGETFVMNLKLPQATDMRDSLSKHLYEKLFCWLIKKLNETTDSPGEVEDWIGVLDIFGFEDFESGNSFEQVCINLANESLQNHYNNFIFKKDLEECRSEGIAVDEMKCPDNSECLKLVTDARGVLGMLDEECRLQTGTDEAFLDKLTQNAGKNPFFAKKPTSRGTFMVKHYAGTVTYTVKGFLDKNRDTLKDDIKLLVRESENPFVAELLPAPEEKRGKQQTVGGFFKLQVSELMNLINQTNPHWIRCVKPHPAKKPLMFDGVQVTNQLESSGVLGTVKIRKAGYPVRMVYQQFLIRYKIIMGRCPVDSPMEEIQAAVKKCMVAANVSGKELQMGKTRVFMKSEAYFALEKTREEAAVKHRLVIQAMARGLGSQHVVRKNCWRENAKLIQQEFRDYLRRSAEAREIRRKAREALLAKHNQERIDFEAEARKAMKEVEDEWAAETKEIDELMRAHHAWVENTAIRNSEERTSFYQLETKKRYDIINEYKDFLNSQVIERSALYLLSLPEEEEGARAKLEREEALEFALIGRLFEEHGRGLFRMEIERSERKFRRFIQRIEDLHFLELLQRAQLFPEFVASLTRAVHPFGPTMRAIKHHTETLVRRAQRRARHREVQQEVESFTTRHPRDSTKLDRELASIALGTIRKHDTGYNRHGDTVEDVSVYATTEAWQGVNGVPDMDQVLKGMHHSRKNAKLSKQQQQQHAEPPAALSDLLAVKDTELKSHGVFETFTSRNQEMEFIRRRHILAQEYKVLARLGRYDGPWVHETEIPDRRTFFVAQDKLQNICLNFSEALVKEIQMLNDFCVKRSIPEQNSVTGQWMSFTAVAPDLVAKYPQCTDWKRLLSERERLLYATENYKIELLKIVRGCISRGAKVEDEELLLVDEESTVEQVYQAYATIKGRFSVCKRCLYPMAGKATLISLRLLWPHVQDTTFTDRCRDCNTSVFSSGGYGSMSGRGKGKALK